MTDTNFETGTVELATELTIAWLSNPNTRASAEEVPGFLQTMHQAVSGLANAVASGESTEATPEYTPAVSVRKSLSSKDHIVSMIDGKKYKTLRRHLSGHGMTPEQYRERYNLRSDYPMVAENYSQARRDMAKKIGLGRKPGMKRGSGGGAAVAAAAEKAATAKRGRRKAGATVAE